MRVLLGLLVALLTAPAAQAAGRADLVIARVEAQVAGGVLSTNATVYNRGSRRAVRNSVEFRIGMLSFHPRASAPALSRNRWWTVTRSYPFGLRPGTTLHVTACADPSGRIRERREDNNCRTSVLVTVPAPAAP